MRTFPPRCWYITDAIPTALHPGSVCARSIMSHTEHTPTTPHRIRASVAGTLDGLFRERVRQSPNRVAYRQYERTQQAWVETRWTEMAQAVARWQGALRTEGLHPGDRVGLQLKNCKEWVIFEQAALGLGLVVIPLYVEDRADNIAYILEDAGVKLLLLGDDHHWQRLGAHIGDIETLTRILLLQCKHDLCSENPRLRQVVDWLPDTAPTLQERGGDPDKLATIVYTSGTTGRPKGVMLSHHNILTDIDSALQLLDVTATDILLSFLPLSHTFERTCDYYGGMMAGCTLTFARSVQQLAEDLQSIRPTVLIAVPRMFERIYERLHSALSRQSFLARALFHLSVRVGWQRFLAHQGDGGWHPGFLLWPLLQRLVVGKVQARLGGRLRMAVSGGAALPPTVARTFIGLDIMVVQGYGMTETSPIVTANSPAHNRPTSVGRAMPGIEVSIGDNDELRVRGPNVMLGYWNNHNATSETISADGWLRTGDQAHIDEDGFVYITGRLKDILIMSNGEKVPPGDMESAITLDPLFDQALVIGEARPFLSALVVLNPEHWVRLARQLGFDPFAPESLQQREVRHYLQKRITRLLHDFPGFAKIRRVTPRLEPWSIDNGLLTPTLKIKRAQVLAQFAHDIEAMYG